MKKFLLLSVAAVMSAVIANANILRVGFFGTHINGVDYPGFNQAVTSAAAGDTILVFPGISNVGGQMAKKLIIIGPGDWLDTTSTPRGNANMQSSPGVANAGNFTFNAGSEGSVVMGLEGGTFDIRANDITIRRNRNITVYLATSGAVYTNLQILENYSVTITAGNTTAASCTNMNVSNNFIFLFNTTVGNTYGGIVSNNVWAYNSTATPGDGGGTAMSYNGGGVELGGGVYLLQNNIFESNNNLNAASNGNNFPFSNAGNSVFNYNMALETATPTNWGVGVGNVITPIANAAKIFAAFPAIGTASADARYQLAVGSPALTVGVGGTPIGMFAGPSPYKLSLIPSIPSVYKLGSPQGNNPSGNTITINVSTRGNN